MDKKPLTSSWPKELKLQEIEEPNKLGKFSDSDDDYDSDDDDDYFEYDDEDDDYDEEDDEYDDDYYDEEIYENNEVSLAFICCCFGAKISVRDECARGVIKSKWVFRQLLV